VDGFSNAAFRLSVNLYGAPALTLKEFQGWEQDLIIGASLRVFVPWGHTTAASSSTSAPIAGLQAGGRDLEGARPMDAGSHGGAMFFTDNNDFFGGNTRSQRPLYSVQGHVIYAFPPATGPRSTPRISPAAERRSTAR
jgi:hypothetical protein